MQFRGKELAQKDKAAETVESRDHQDPFVIRHSQIIFNSDRHVLSHIFDR